MDISGQITKCQPFFLIQLKILYKLPIVFQSPSTRVPGTQYQSTQLISPELNIVGYFWPIVFTDR